MNPLFLLIPLLIVVGLLVFFLSKQESSVSAVEPRCHPTNAPYRNATLPVDERVNDLLGRMTQREKIGQLALIEKNGLQDINDIRDYTLGALLSGSGSRPATNTPLDWLTMVNEYQAKAQETCLGIPLLYGIDAIHGHGGVQGATVFPHAIGLAASHDPGLVERVAKATTKEMTATGIYWNYAPSLDIPQDQRWGRVYETFGSDPKTAATLGVAFIRGTQKEENGHLTALATPKHFVGNGATTWDSSTNKSYRLDQGDVTLNEQQLRAEHIEPFKKAIDAGALVIMAGLNSWNGEKLSGHRQLLTDVLKKELGFQGFIVSDWYGLYSLSEDRYTATVMGINAGIDMAMLPFEYKLFMTDMEQALTRGDISEERLNDAVRRILTAKFKVGLFDRPAATPERLSVIGSDAHHDIAREAVRKSQTLLENKKRTLPLPRSARRILVAGSAAHNIGWQSGGWTIEWQGIEGNSIPGTTILEGIKRIVTPTTRVSYDLSGEFGSNKDLADIGIVVVGEKPYAEGVGDNADPRLTEEDLQTIKKVRARSKKLVVVIISGRALTLPTEANTWDAIVAAWLPGSEGQGVADTLFGLSPYTATLPVSWKPYR